MGEPSANANTIFTPPLKRGCYQLYDPASFEYTQFKDAYVALNKESKTREGYTLVEDGVYVEKEDSGTCTLLVLQNTGLMKNGQPVQILERMQINKSKSSEDISLIVKGDVTAERDTLLTAEFLETVDANRTHYKTDKWGTPLLLLKDKACEENEGEVTIATGASLADENGKLKYHMCYSRQPLSKNGFAMTDYYVQNVKETECGQAGGLFNKDSAKCVLPPAKNGDANIMENVADGDDGKKACTEKKGTFVPKDSCSIKAYKSQQEAAPKEDNPKDKDVPITEQPGLWIVLAVVFVLLLLGVFVYRSQAAKSESAAEASSSAARGARERLANIGRFFTG